MDIQVYDRLLNTPDPEVRPVSGGNLQRLRQCLVELHLPTFREHHGSQAALATKESWSYP